jgi:hypothetical protein
MPFELVFAERKYIMVYYGNEILKDAEPAAARSSARFSLPMWYPIRAV